ncbi:hypothetical protein GCM10007981_08870 [Thermocladium modestius]|uniref:Uncharacterized protein n=1 Tax=Thermocladium modestius TaxID=62609 RepID=A0A830GVP2_9CREN|nr:hypothetical protein [Thermocladium modestius]GGP20507.1 hypothetical protein GCM10007981_08870 [Thermocladium modestius]
MRVIVKHFRNSKELRAYVDTELASLRRELMSLSAVTKNYSGEDPLPSNEAFKEIVFKNSSGQEIFNARIYYKASKNTEMLIINEAIAYIKKKYALLEDFKKKIDFIMWDGPLLVLMVDSIPYIIIMDKNTTNNIEDEK